MEQLGFRSILGDPIAWKLYLQCQQILEIQSRHNKHPPPPRPSPETNRILRCSVATIGLRSNEVIPTIKLSENNQIAKFWGYFRQYFLS